MKETFTKEITQTLKDMKNPFFGVMLGKISKKIALFLVRGFLISFIVFINGCGQEDGAKNTALFPGDPCESSRKSPDQLNALLKCMVKNGDVYSPGPGNLGGKDDACKYLSVAVNLVKSNILSSKEYKYISINMIEDLPIKDFVKIWAPTVNQAYKKKFINEEQLIESIFPATRLDIFLAYKDTDVRSFYESLLNEGSIISLKVEIFHPWNTAEELIKAIINGDTAAYIEKAVKDGKLNQKPRLVDTETTCLKKK